jgi:hypothetical protein
MLQQVLIAVFKDASWVKTAGKRQNVMSLSGPAICD